MKHRPSLLLPLLAISLMAVPVCKGTVVFSDGFSQAAGTLIVGKAADVGGTWTQNGTSANGLTISAVNSLNTQGNGRQVFNSFTASLGTGKVLTLSYDAVTPAAALANGWAGVSLYDGFTSGSSPGNEDMFAGDPSASAWGTDGHIGRFFGTDNMLNNHITLTYVYDTGAWTFSTTNGFSASGIGPAHYALNGLRVGNGGGADINLDNLTVDISPVPVVTFAAVSPANGSYSGSRTSVSLQAIDGLAIVNASTIVMQVDGGTVTPGVAKSGNVTTINYVPGSPLGAGTLHTAEVTLADSNGALYTNAWSFTTAFQSLPSVLPGPIVASNQESGIVIFSTNDAWMGANYNASSGKTIYASFSLEFDNLNGETGGGNGYGGLQFILGGSSAPSAGMHVIAGNNWISTNWSFDPYPQPFTDLLPVTPIVFHEWHTIAERVDYSPIGNATVTLWLDPDFTQPEGSQPNPPVVVSTVDTFDTVALRTGNGTTSATFSNIVMSATGPFPHSAPVFQNLTPGANDPAAAIHTPIGALVVFGTYGISTSTVGLTLDGNPVAPSFAVTTNSITVNYQPPTSFVPNSPHTVGLSVTDSNGTPYSTSWSFTADPYPTLPITIPGPIFVNYSANGDAGSNLFTSENEWIGTNYQSSSTNTLYTTFTMAFGDLNGETADDQGGCYGGLHFFEGGPAHIGVERLLVGESWLRNTWSIDDKAGGEGGELALPPTIAVVTFEYHTMTIKSVYSAGGNATETVWLDPDFTKSEGNQPNPPVVVSMVNTFDTICLRCGNGTANAQFKDIMLAATSPFAPGPGTLNIQNSGGGINLSWTGAGTLQTAAVVTGPWTDSVNQSNPQVVAATNSAAFFRLRP
ncbi:MAG: hypothetical protein P4N60_22095 [Verrucomicrobiae bacterium]|nr:hypothetical protein [Verrucomicrobiae bacterium]